MKRYHRKFSNKQGITLLEIIVGFSIGVIATAVLLVGVSYIMTYTAKNSVYQRAANINAGVVTRSLANNSYDEDFRKKDAAKVEILQFKSINTTTTGKYTLPMGFVIEKCKDGQTPSGIYYDGMTDNVDDAIAGEACSNNRSVMLCRKPSAVATTGVAVKADELHRGCKYDDSDPSSVTEKIVWCHKPAGSDVWVEDTNVSYYDGSGTKYSWNSLEITPAPQG